MNTTGIRGIVQAIAGTLTRSTTTIAIPWKDLQSSIYVRVPSSDVPTFEQIFVFEEYGFNVGRTPETIIDAGANIGLASIYFAHKFPRAKIIAIEPEMNNFEILKMNCNAYENISIIQGALWSSDEKVDLIDPGLGYWGYRTETRNGNHPRANQKILEVQGYSIPDIMNRYNFDSIDILKVDIEGAETEVFRDTSAWIDKIDSLVVELHESLIPGSSQVFYNATHGFDYQWNKGENVLVTRKHGCLIPE